MYQTFERLGPHNKLSIPCHMSQLHLSLHHSWPHSTTPLKFRRHFLSIVFQPMFSIVSMFGTQQFQPLRGPFFQKRLLHSHTAGVGRMQKLPTAINVTMPHLTTGRKMPIQSIVPSLLRFSSLLVLQGRVRYPHRHRHALSRQRFFGFGRTAR